MLRYLLIATCIVFVIGGIAAALHRSGADLRVASVQSTASPSPPRYQAPSTFTPGPVTGDAPWALSAVPECFHQQSEARGSASFALAHLPQGAVVLRSGSTVASADCIAWARDDDVVLVRGAERLRVPGGRLYLARNGAGVAVLTRDAGRTVLRVYRPVSTLTVRPASR